MSDGPPECVIPAVHSAHADAACSLTEWLAARREAGAASVVLEGRGQLGVAWVSSGWRRGSLVAEVPMTNMEGGGGASPAPSPTPQDQPTDLRVSRAPERPHQHMARPVPLKHSSPPPLTALPLGLQQLVRAPSSFMIGDILRQKAQEVGTHHHHHHHDDGDDDEDEDESGSQHALSRQGERPLATVCVCVCVAYTRRPPGLSLGP